MLTTTSGNINFIRDTSMIGQDVYASEKNRRPMIQTDMITTPRFEKQPTKPAVYRIEIKTIDNNKTFKLIKDYDRMPEEKKIYGKLNKYAERAWNTYVKLRDRGKFGFGLAAVGYKGMGKTDFLSILANKAIDNGMIVVLVTNVKASIELVNFLNTINNVFVMFDEFAKNFNYDLQEKMLTMFNNLDSKNRFLALSENSLRDISDLFLDRPGRIHYLFEFETTDNETIEAYCKDNNISEKLKLEILSTARRISNFSFDFLKGIAIEHSLYPDDTLAEMLEYLNLKKLQKRTYLDILTIEKITRDLKDRTKYIDRYEIDFSYREQMKEKDFKDGRYVYLQLNGKKISAEEKAQQTEDLKKKLEQDGASKMVLNNFQANNFMPTASEKINFNINMLELIEKEEKNGVEYFTYSYGDYVIKITFRE